MADIATTAEPVEDRTRPPAHRRRGRGRWIRWSVGIAGLALLSLLVPATPGSAAPGTDQRAGGYLALGDSVAFGYTPPEATPPLTYLHAANFVGYPEDVAHALGLTVTNASCPGETSASLISATAQSNGCENSLGSPFGYRTLFPLHVAYTGAQLDFAVAYLRSHPRTRLVTLNIGANDAFICQKTTADNCTGTDSVALLHQLTANLTTIYTALRSTAHYRGPLVLVSYYALNYADPSQTVATEGLNAALAGVTQHFGGIVADGYGLFERASAAFGSSPCKAGLQVPLPAGGCDIHPSVAGHLVLAAATEEALAGSHALP